MEKISCCVPKYLLGILKSKKGYGCCNISGFDIMKFIHRRGNGFKTR